MDQNTTLETVLDRALKVLNADDAGRDPEPEDAVELAQAVADLHRWIRIGGALPELWTRKGRL